MPQNNLASLWLNFRGSCGVIQRIRVKVWSRIRNVIRCSIDNRVKKKRIGVLGGFLGRVKLFPERGLDELVLVRPNNG